MSIYRRPGWTYGSNVQQFPAQGSAATPASSPPSGPSAGTQEWSDQRKARPVEHILPATARWLRLLPPDVYPGALVAQYPRIVNLIAMQWNDREACPAFFNTLLVDKRGGRKGFSDAVKGDLLKLFDYWYDERPMAER